METKIEVPEREWRSAVIERAEPSSEDDRTIELSFSSEEPYQRWWGVEVLGHKRSEVDLSFIGSGRAPLLVDHKRNIDDQVGVIKKVWIDSGRGRASVRFGKAERAMQLLERVRDGELSNISVGYEIRSMRLESEVDGLETYRVTDWKPHEISIVSVPADSTVGIGRSDTPMKTLVIERNKSMTKETEAAPVIEQAPAAEVRQASPSKPEVDPEVIRAEERKRVEEISSIGAKFNMGDKAREAIRNGVSVAAFNGEVLEHLGSDASSKMAAANSIGLTEKEAKRFSFLKATRYLANPRDGRAAEDAAFEIEVGEAAAEKMERSGRKARGLVVPTDVLAAPRQEVRTTLTYGTAATAGNLVATELDSASFIDVLRNAMKVRSLGARILNDLVGDLDIPRKSVASSAAWVSAEGGDAGETNPQFDLVSFRLKTLGGYTDVTRKMMAQSSMDVENLVRDDLAMSIALAIDLAALHGTGSSGQPTGIAATSGIGSVVGGTNGAAPDWADIVNLETEVAVDNADIGSLAYLTNAKVRGKLKQTEKASGTAQFVWQGTEMNGYRAEVSNQVSSTLTKGTSSGVASAIFYGNWADLMIGFWSGVDLLVDPYTLGKSGGVRLRALQDCDIQVRHPQSFAAMLDALTA